MTHSSESKALSCLPVCSLVSDFDHCKGCRHRQRGTREVPALVGRKPNTHTKSFKLTGLYAQGRYDCKLPPQYPHQLVNHLSRPLIGG